VRARATAVALAEAAMAAAGAPPARADHPSAPAIGARSAVATGIHSAPSRADHPSAPTRARAWIAQLAARTPAWPRPRAHGSPRMLEPLGAWTGGPVGLLVLRARARWVQVRLPTRPNRAAAWIRADRVVLRPTRWRVEIDVGERRVTALRDGRPVRSFGAVVGAPATPTPRGRFALYEVDRQPDPFGFLGPVALHLTAHSGVLDDYGGGPGRVAVHGRGGASLLDPLGSAASHGCIRVDSGQAAWLARKLRPGVPVTVT
jgi:lipoprotein-anchoring transpeptidase ErfK/SrfK